MDATSKIFRAFYETKEHKLYFSELKALTKLSNSSLQNALDNLARKKLISLEKTKAHTYIELKDKNAAIHEFAKLDIEKFNALNINARIPLADFAENAPRTVAFILLFGSASRKQEKEGSDIDLMIVLHEFKNKKLQKLYEQETTKEFEALKKEIEFQSIYPLSLAITTINEFLESEDHLVSQARMTGFPIKNPQTYHELMINELQKISRRQKRIGKQIP